MTNDDATGDADEAARWFVRVDSGSEPNVDAALAGWLAEPGNERALERVELAVALGRRLAADPTSALYAEAARATERAPRRSPRLGWLVWGGALAAALLVAVFIVRDRAPEAPRRSRSRLRATSPSMHRAMP